MNNVQLLGRITTDPELRATANGTKVTSFKLAVNGMKNANGEQRTDFIPITVWEKQAENICKYINKGDQLVINGKIQTSNYEDKDGNKRTKVEVLGTNIYFVGTKKKEETSLEEEFVAPDKVVFEDDELPF